MPKTKRTSLKESLKTHQQRAAIIVQHSKSQASRYTPSQSGSRAKKLSSSSKSLPPSLIDKGKRKTVIPYYSNQKILLVGEGNFSFARSLLRSSSTLISPSLLVATSYDSQAVCYEKYPDSEEIVREITSRGATVLFEVDATRLSKNKELGKCGPFDIVAWNFPHVGSGIKDQDRNIFANQRVLADFFQSVAPHLVKGKEPESLLKPRRKKKQTDDTDNEDESDLISDEDSLLNEMSIPSASSSATRGSVLITLRDASPYTLWNVPKLAKFPPVEKATTEPPRSYTLIRSFTFHPEDYEGYEHRRTIGGATGLAPNSDLRKGVGGCRTWEFVLKDVEVDPDAEPVIWRKFGKPHVRPDA